MECGADTTIEGETMGPQTVLLSHEEASNIELFCSIAQENGHCLTLKQIIELTSLKLSEEELIATWNTSVSLGAKYIIDEGIVYERGVKDRALSKKELLERERRAEFNIRLARNFLGYLGKPNSLVLSISGSTSYLSVSEKDDLDFFCIARTRSMWLLMLRALILARLFRLVCKGTPQICLSYVMDEQFASKEFLTPQDGLFARDALSTIVIHGEEYYGALLKKSKWMERYFPSLYRSKTLPQKEVPGTLPINSLVKIVNHFLYFTLGSYIRVKSYLLNRRFTYASAHERLFTIRLGADHCIYESVNYLNLRKKYSKIES